MGAIRTKSVRRLSPLVMGFDVRIDVTKREQYCLAVGSTSRSELMLMKSPPKYPSSTLMLDQDFSVHISGSLQNILPPEAVPLSNPPISIVGPTSGSPPRPSRPPPCYSPSESLPFVTTYPPTVSHPEKIISVPINVSTSNNLRP